MRTVRGGSEEGIIPAASFWIPSLDGIRALAFAIVFVAHVNGDRGGMVGVTIFFFLSGFLITTLLRRENDRNGTISLRNFYIRRAIRILPPLYLTILFLLVLSLTNVLQNSLTPGFYAACSTFFANYWIILSQSVPAIAVDNPGLGPFWSLAVEEHFYFFFPVLFLLMNRFRVPYRKQAIYLAGLCAAILAWRLYLAFHPGPTTSFHLLYGTDTRIDSILFGCIMALAANPVLDPSIRQSRYMVFAGAGLLIATSLVKNPIYRETFHYTLQGIALIPLFMAAICYSSTWFNWLNSKWIRYIGTISYTLYLVHRGLLYVAFEHINVFWVAVISALAAALLYAFLMNILVERPLSMWRKYFHTKAPN